MPRSTPTPGADRSEVTSTQRVSFVKWTEREARRLVFLVSGDIADGAVASQNASPSNPAVP